MPQRLAVLGGLALVCLSLGGCTKCGWIWKEGARSCHADKPR